MKVVNIQWNVDMDEVYELLDEMPEDKAAEALKVPVDKYTKFSLEERHNIAEDLFRHQPAELDSFLQLPDEIEIPENVSEEFVADWLSDTYGYYHSGYAVVK